MTPFRVKDQWNPGGRKSSASPFGRIHRAKMEYGENFILARFMRTHT